MKNWLAPFAICLIAASLLGASLRWSIEPPGNTSDQSALIRADLQTTQRSLMLGYGVLAASGLAFMVSDQWPIRIGGALSLVASGLLANLLGAFWLCGVLIGVPLLIVAALKKKSS